VVLANLSVACLSAGDVVMANDAPTAEELASSPVIVWPTGEHHDWLDDDFGTLESLMTS